MIEKFTCRRKSSRWTMNCFMYVLDVAAYNSFVLFSIKTPDFINSLKNRSRRLSLENLSKSMIRPLIENRLQVFSSMNFKHIKSSFFDSVNKTGINYAKSVTPQTTPVISPACSPTKHKKRGKCYHQECLNANHSKRPRTICDFCSKFICENHKKISCLGCLQKLEINSL